MGFLDVVNLHFCLHLSDAYRTIFTIIIRALLIGMLFVPSVMFATEDTVTRRDGFLLIWESILRPASDTNASFDDIADSDTGALEIRYAKRRGILEDEESFRPDEPLMLRDAILWIYRTRNIRELPDMTLEDLPELIAEYPLIEMKGSLDVRVSEADVLAMITTLDAELRSEVHEVSFYGDAFQGDGTAFGEKFDKNAMTAAHRSFPHNTLVRVTNLENEESVVVRINDRGPYVHGRDMDLSEAAFRSIAHLGQGVLRSVAFQRLGDLELADPCEESEPQYQRRITSHVHFFRGVPHRFGKGGQLILQSNRAFVVQGITFPDGRYLRIQDFVLSGEKYRFTPSEDGLHVFLFGDTRGRERSMRMTVSSCVKDAPAL